MKTVGVIGWPLGHTLSPVFQQAALDHAGIAARFETWPTPPDALQARLAEVRGEDCLACCVTLPHKRAVIPLLDHLAPSAKAIDAVNWMIKEDGRLVGHNTDGEGFLRALKADAGCDPAGRHALVLGAGGAARAVVHALKSSGVGEMVIANRSVDRAQALADAFAGEAFQPRAIGMSDDVLAEAAAASDLIVNTTSIGMTGGPAPDASPLPSGAIPPGAVCYDLVYAPAVTPFLRAAEAAGAVATGGLGMLIHQGAVGFELFSGRPAPVDVMFAAVSKAAD